MLGLRPAWALGSAGAIAAFPVLGGVEALSLLREHDDANARAAIACGTRWKAAGREVFNVWPNSGKDVNDAIKEGAA
jgi:putative DNA primase/helicase